MKAWVALGANLGDRRQQLEAAARRLKGLSRGGWRASPLVESPALTLPGSPSEWRLPFLNAVVTFDWENSAEELLRALKQIESELGRKPAARWAPREIDLDLLALGEERRQTPDLTLPHPEIGRRAFVLNPLLHLGYPGALKAHRQLKDPLPLWMSIVNLTPDSFANIPTPDPDFDLDASLIDLGAESTRPGARLISPEEEWSRLERPLLSLKHQLADRCFRPRMSVDTRHARTARRALAAGADMINDVSGLSDPEMLGVLRESTCDYVFMHSLSIPADPKKTMTDADVVTALIHWAERRLETLSSQIALERVIFDPGIGFGKTAAQSWEILARVRELHKLPVRLMIGHSRKSFLQRLGQAPAVERDPETLGVSLALAAQGVEILRVHNTRAHRRAHLAWRETWS